jgi:hypothetical protein
MVDVSDDGDVAQIHQKVPKNQTRAESARDTMLLRRNIVSKRAEATGGWAEWLSALQSAGVGDLQRKGTLWRKN